MYVDSRKLKLVIAQRNAIRSWLETHAQSPVQEQKQLDAETPEQVYWHYGYQAALTDLINLMAFEPHQDGIAGTPN